MQKKFMYVRRWTSDLILTLSMKEYAFKTNIVSVFLYGLVPWSLNELLAINTIWSSTHTRFWSPGNQLIVWMLLLSFFVTTMLSELPTSNWGMDFWSINSLWPMPVSTWRSGSGDETPSKSDLSWSWQLFLVSTTASDEVQWPGRSWFCHNLAFTTAGWTGTRNL